MPLNEGNAGVTYKIVDIAPKLVSNLIVYIKGSRYSIDSRLAKAIYVSLDW